MTHTESGAGNILLRKHKSSPAALRAIQTVGKSAAEFLERHVRGDWGSVCAEDGELNDEAGKDGSRPAGMIRQAGGKKEGRGLANRSRRDLFPDMFPIPFTSGKREKRQMLRLALAIRAR